MTALSEFASSHPTQQLGAGDILIAQGDEGRDLFVLVSGKLSVARDGIEIATIDRAGSLVGEMSVVLGTAATATVRAATPSTVRAIRDARRHLQQDPAMTFQLARLMAMRLDATSSVLVDLMRQNNSRSEQSLIGRIFAALHVPADDAGYAPITRNDMFGTGAPGD
jgi:CRP/FNR family transcriptional regulator, cyclic AMP receptor protein